MPKQDCSFATLMWQSCFVSNAIENVSDWITVPEAAERLGVPLGRVHRMLEEHDLIFVKIDGVKKIPAEIIVDQEPLSSLKGTVSVLLDSGFSLEGAVEWLYTPDETLPGTPMGALLAGRKTEIRRRAQALAI